MKYLFILFGLTFGLTAFSKEESDSRFKDILDTQDAEMQIERVLELFFKTSDVDPIQTLRDQQELLSAAEKKKNLVVQSLATSCMGYGYRGVGNNKKSLEYALRARTMATETGNKKLLAITNNIVGVCYKDLEDYDRAKKHFKELIELCGQDGCEKVKSWGLQNLSDVYLKINELDSALMYSQEAFRISMILKEDLMKSYTYLSLGSIYSQLDYDELAIGYFNRAILEGKKQASPKQLNWVYTAMSEYYLGINKIDSAVLYARRAIQVVETSAFAIYQLQPAKILLELYKETNIDSAFKYSEVYRIANDKMFNSKVIQQTQLLTFEDERREQQYEAEKENDEHERQMTMQYILISIGVGVLILAFLLLSRVAIHSAKVIEFMGVIILLIVFEFLNLLLHGFLVELTDHTPVLMLIGLVGIATILVPMHHKLEHWAVATVTHKNKLIRLKRAKQTIEQLEGEV